MGNKPVSMVRFGMNELKRHYKKKGPSADQKKWMAIEKSFATARECVREHERNINRWEEQGREAVWLIEEIKAGGEPW